MARKTDTLDVFNNVETLDDYFKKEKEGHEQLNKWRIQQEKYIAKEQERAVKQAVSRTIDEKKKLEASGVKMTAKLEAEIKKQAIKKYNKERQKEEVALQNKIFKEQYNIQTKYDKKRRQEEIKSRLAENKEVLSFYDELAKKRKLTKKETKDQQERQKEVKEANALQIFEKVEKSLNSAFNALSSAINAGMSAYSKNQTRINTRLMGAHPLRYGAFNKFGTIETHLTTAVGVNPYFKTETMLDNLNALVEAGIVSNIEQRTFLQTAKDDIATTFDAANSALLRIIRLQQQDSTAARLGMESYLTKFLNNLVENTEYMNQTFDNVAGALLEASSVMGAAQATEFEYVVQKWLGSLTGTGLSESSATSIAQAIGYLGSGNISALGGTNMLNLVTMAASRAGMDIGSILTKGLNTSSTDLLMKSLVEYMVELGGNGSNVVKSELAQTFGLSFSDLVAARQIKSSIKNIYGRNLSNLGMYAQLGTDLSTIALRTPMASMIDTLWENLEFGLASNIAKNPNLAAIWKVTDMIQSNTGGINIPEAWFQAVGTGGGFSLNTTIENLVKLGVVGASSLGMIGDVISGLSSTLAPASALLKLGITPWTTKINRGSGIGTLSSGLATSVSSITMRSNSSGDDIYESTLTGAENEGKNKQNKVRDEAQNQIQQYVSSTDGLESDMNKIVDNTAQVISILNNILYRMDGEFEIKNQLNVPSNSNWYF